MINRQVHHLSFWKRLLLFPVYIILRLWYATLHLVVTPEARHILNQFPSRACIFYFWHCHLFVAPLLRKFRKKREMYGLMSASKDGAWLEALIKKFRVKAIRGSSTWRGAQALKELSAYVNVPCDIVITPDGPKGPCQQCKLGSFQWVQQQGCPIILLHFELSRAWRLNSWDKFCLPHPFSSVYVTAHWYPTSPSLEELVDNAQKHL